MFTKEDNEILTRVGAGTPMGELFRRYWIPALLSEELPEPDCTPVRVRLLGEDLVAFRDTTGRVGLLGEYCSHRRASLFYGRNEECGLTCVYHGWKYDADGNVVDMPAEPEQSQLKNIVKHKAYPCREANGLVLTYMGPPALMPLVPAFPWHTMSQDHISVGSKVFLECNWLQALEGDNDSIHTPYLHRRASQRGGRASMARLNPASVKIDRLPWGVRAATIYPVDDGQEMVRTNTFLMPCMGNTPRGESIDGLNTAVHTIYQVPADDYTNWRYDLETWWNDTVDGMYQEGDRSEVGPGFMSLYNRGNDYLIDRVKQKSGEVYSGVDARNHTQDKMVTESMGAITDRTQENLAASDLHVIEVRRFLLKAARDLQEGIEPPGVAYTDEENQVHDYCYMITNFQPRGADWKASLPQGL